MALIVDPDNLSQGALTVVSDLAFTASAGAVTTLTGTATLPSITAGDFFEIRNHSVPGNNGLYLETGGTPTTSSITCTKQVGVNPVNATAESTDFLGNNTVATNEKTVFFDTAAREIHLFQQGNLSTDGVTMQALYSFMKEEWKDQVSNVNLVAFPFPATAITPEQFELADGWNFNADADRQLIRTGGWREIDENSILQKEYAGIVTLGNFEDNVNDNAHYQTGDDPTDTSGATNFVFNGPVNEVIQTYEENLDASTNTISFTNASPDTITRTSGSWITDGYRVGAQVTVRNAANAANNGTFVIDVMTATVLTVSAVGGGDAGLVTDAADTQAFISKNFRNALKVFLRVRDGDTNGKTFVQQDLADIGVTTLSNQVFRFPLSNATDLKILETDANIDANTPYTEIRLRYLAGTYNREVDTTTKRDFGIIVDVGTYSQSNGSVVAVSDRLDSANFNLGAGEALADYTGGTLIIHEGTDQGSHTISGTPVDNAGTLEITVTSDLTGSDTNVSFTMQRSSPVVATAEEIFEKVQRQLRLAGDIDETGNVVTGRTADELLLFVGDTLVTGRALPVNPNGGGSGVFIEGFDSNDTNRLTFTDNGGVERTFPFVAAGSINFNPNLVNDATPEYTMFFEYSTRTTVTDLALSGASGDTASLDSAGSNLPTLVQNDYIALAGMTNPANNGVWIVTDAAPTAAQADIRKVDGQTVVNEGAGSRTLDENPINSPGAIIVNDNGGTPITGAVGGASVGFDFDYDGNTQGGRTAATDADVVLRAIGTDTAQFVETTGTITRAVGQSFSLVAALERNFNNP